MKDIIIRWAALIGIGIASFFVGLQYERQTAVPQIQTVAQLVDKVTTKIVRVKETAPDGTVKETVSTDKIEDRRAATVIPPPLTIKKRNNYSLGLRWHPSTYIPVEASVGRRLIGDVWLEAGANWHEKTHFLLGVRVDF